MTMPSVAEVEAFLVDEARLLDARDWNAWNQLFTPDGIYWIPAQPGQVDPLRNVSLIYEDALLREVRIRRFADRNAFSLQGGPRGWRIVANVRIDSSDPSAGALMVSSRLMAAEYQRERTSRFEAFVTHRLVVEPGRFRIALKRVELLDCDAAHGDISLYL
jgi:benzoate/toluate 1,2-dioxygenase beta subunit